MRQVELIPGLKSSALGFGCAPAMGSVDKDRSTRAIGIALSQGINHFDVAPSYGYGEAEALLGECVRGHRDEVVICTKYGIDATMLARIAKPLKGVVRRIRGSGKPGGATTTVSRRMLQPVPITPDGLAKSVERSLRRMRTDRLDILLLHEPAEALEGVDGLFETAGRLKQAGKILGFGIALANEGFETHRAYLERFEVLQFAAPWREESLPGRGREGILFSPFADQTENKREALVRLQAQFPNSVILCSMYSEPHIRENASLFAAAAKP